jgi:ubiquinone/menaquinone biosynthesis C-methylase UbiE
MKIPSGNELLDPYHILKDELGVGPNNQLADLGCGGVGHFSIQAGKLVGPKGTIHAVDVLKEALSSVQNRAKMEKLDNIRTHWSNLEKFGALKIHDQTQDFVLVVNVLFQNKNRESIIKESIRLLKQHGKILIIDWAPGRFPVGPEPDQKITPESIRALLGQLGLIELKYFNPGKYHFGFIFEKQ